MATKISFLNLKGGVGKTSLLVNVGSCLAYMGKRVLIVDFDAQSNSSIWLMRLDRWNALNRSPEKFLLNLFRDPKAKIGDCIQKSPVKDADGEEPLPNLDLVPASFSLLDLEHETPNTFGSPFYARFHEEISEIESAYDYILYDCPPSFYHAPQCAVFNSDWVLVPANADGLSIIGFHLLVDKLVKFRKSSANYRNSLDAPDPQILGVCLNAIKPGVNINASTERFKTQIKRFADQSKVTSTAHLFPHRIRHSVTVGRSVMQGLPMVLMSKSEGSMNVAEDYILTAKHIEQAVSGKPIGTPANTV